MEVEHLIRSFPVDDNLQKEVQALEAEGWQVVPGVPPVMVYHLVRQKKAPEAPKEETPPLPHALGKLLINDDLIMVLGADGKRKQ